MPPAQSIRVRILNRDFSLRVDEQDEELTRDLARYVNSKMQEFMREHPDQPEITASIIAAMAIAEELFTEREQREQLESALDDEFEELSSRLEEAGAKVRPVASTTAVRPVDEPATDAPKGIDLD